MWRSITRRMEEQPLFWLTLVAAVPRLLAAFFAGGYFAQDDHFLVIEAAQSWVDGFDYNNWLPGSQHGLPHATGHMMVYPGLHFLLFKGWQWLGLTDPDLKMVLVRVLHACWSLLTVRYGYRIAWQLAGGASSPEARSIAWRCGLFLALLWFLPFVSVRNMVEVVSMPLLMMSAWWLMRPPAGAEVRKPWMPAALAAGLFAGLAINIRFQTLFFPAGAGLALLLLRRWKDAALFAVGVVLPVIVLQGGIDLALWGGPFQEMTEYVRYNLANPDNTGIHLPWYDYVLVLAAVFVPPFSLAVLFGFARRPRPLLLWLPVLVFLFFHSIFPNKQERFLLPIVPLFFVLGYVHWEQWRQRSAWWHRHVRLWRGLLAWTWGLNTLLLVPLCFSYSKRERVEAMELLRGQNVHGMIIEDTVEQDPPMPPLFYWGHWSGPKDPYVDMHEDLKKLVDQNLEPHRANAILFIGDEDLAARVANATRAMGPLRYVGTARPGLLDRTVHWLNPVNRNAVIVVYVKR